VIAIVTVLLGLLLPALQKVREAAARVQCANNLKQIGLACHLYHDENRHLPVGYLATSPYPSTAPGWGWGAFLLPYLEQPNLFKHIDFQRPCQQPTVIQQIVPDFVCPSDSMPQLYRVTDELFSIVCVAAPSSYAACAGDDSTEVEDERGNGVFYRNSRTRCNDIRDGLSQTILIGERAWEQTQGTWAGAPSTGVVRPGPLNPWQSTTLPSPAFVLAHANWINNHADADGGLDDFSSLHPGGANFLFADGSVHFLPSIGVDGPAHQAFMALGTRSAGDWAQGLDY
jgi:prepilin-type processing-associated H-X9-DG protein